MGNVFTTTISVLIDWLAGSITAAIWEWVFPAYSSSDGKVKCIVEGALQLGAVCVTAPYILDLITPASVDKSSTIGLIGVMYFALFYSDNLQAKLKSVHNYAKNMSLLYAGGFQKSSLVPQNHPVQKALGNENKEIPQ